MRIFFNSKVNSLPDYLLIIAMYLICVYLSIRVIRDPSFVANNIYTFPNKYSETALA